MRLLLALLLAAGCSGGRVESPTARARGEERRLPWEEVRAREEATGALGRAAELCSRPRGAGGESLSMKASEPDEVKRVAQLGLGESCAVFLEARAEASGLGPESPDGMSAVLREVQRVLADVILNNYNPRGFDVDAVCEAHAGEKTEDANVALLLASIADACDLRERALRESNDPKTAPALRFDRRGTTRVTAATILKGEQAVRLRRKLGAR